MLNSNYREKTPALHSIAENLPFDGDAFDASMALVTVYHWPDVAKGLLEMRRVTRGPVLVMTYDPEAMDKFWTAEYFPELLQKEKSRNPCISEITWILGGQKSVHTITIPFDCTDGFQEAFYSRPEAFLDEKVGSPSLPGFLSTEKEEELVHRLEKDLLSGAWDAKHRTFRSLPIFGGSLRLIVSNPQNEG